MSTYFGIKLPLTANGLLEKTGEQRVGAVLSVNKNSVKGRSPFFNISMDKNSNEVAKLFIDAVAKNGIEDAKSYLSKRLKAVGMINFDELKEVFNEGAEYKYLNKVRFGSLPESIVTSSILIMNNQIQRNSIIHLYMINEPDIFGNWKICGIEKE